MQIVVSGETSFRELNTLIDNADGQVLADTVFQTRKEAERCLDMGSAAVALFWSVPVLCEDGSTIPDTPLDYAETVKRLNRRILDLHSTAYGADWESSMQEAELLRSYITKLSKYYYSTPKSLYALVYMPDVEDLEESIRNAESLSGYMNRVYFGDESNA